MSSHSSTISTEDGLTVRQVPHLPPGCDVPPSADAGKGVESAQRSAQASSNLLVTMDSPDEVVVGEGGRRPARCVYRVYTPEEADTVLFRALLTSEDFDGASRLCDERLLVARTEREQLVWTKDAAIVRWSKGSYADAYTLLVSAHRLAEPVMGALRGKYENTLGYTFDKMGRPLDALEHFRRAQHFHTDPVMKAGVDNNLGRLLTKQGDPASSFKHFERALRAAREAGDILLEAEVLESSALAHEAQEDFRSARAAALESVELLEGTGNVLAIEESKATLNRLISRIRP